MSGFVIEATDLVEVAFSLCDNNDLEWNLKVFTALQSFFISIRPSLIQLRTRTFTYIHSRGCPQLNDSAEMKGKHEGLEREECSPLAADIGDSTRFSIDVFGDKAEQVKKGFGFVVDGGKQDEPRRPQWDICLRRMLSV